MILRTRCQSPPLAGKSYAASKMHGFPGLENRDEEAIVRSTPILSSLRSPYLPTVRNGTFRIATRHLLTTVFLVGL